MLTSLCEQTFLPKHVVVVNDNSSDATQNIVDKYVDKYNWVSVINTTSSSEHLPGAKVINAFYKGFETLDNAFDIICKFDADIILPQNYLEKISEIFKQNPKVGIAGGLAYIEKNNHWVYENVANKNHVRGPFKAYRKACFKDIGGLKNSIGWDTVDVLLAQYNNWEIKTDVKLKVKHLKPTGKTYNKASKYMQGEALYKMRYGFGLTFISALKRGFKRKKFDVFKDYIIGYFKAIQSNQTVQIVSKAEGKFIRRLRWKGVFKSLGF